MSPLQVWLGGDLGAPLEGTHVCQPADWRVRVGAAAWSPCPSVGRQPVVGAFRRQQQSLLLLQLYESADGLAQASGQRRSASSSTPSHEEELWGGDEGSRKDPEGSTRGWKADPLAWNGLTHNPPISGSGEREGDAIIYGKRGQPGKKQPGIQVRMCWWFPKKKKQKQE